MNDLYPLHKTVSLFEELRTLEQTHCFIRIEMKALAISLARWLRSV